MPIWKMNFCFQYYLDGEKGRKQPCVLRMVREVEISGDGFGNVLTDASF